MNPIKDDDVIIDMHTHATGIALTNYLTCHYPSTQSILELNQKLIENGVGFAVVFPMPNRPEFDLGRYLKIDKRNPSKIPYRLANETLLLEINKFKLKNMLPFFMIDMKEMVDEQIQFLEENRNNFFGIKIHTCSLQQGIFELEKSSFLDYFVTNKIPVLLHTKPKSDLYGTRRILEFAIKHPDLRICAAHLCDLDFALMKEVEIVPNLFIDCSPFCSFVETYDVNFKKYSNLDIRHLFSIIANEYLPQSLLWGTDSPWHAFSVSSVSYKDEVDLLHSLKYKDMQRIANTNSRKFLFDMKY